MILTQYAQIQTTAHSSRGRAVIDTVVWHWTGGYRDAVEVARIDYQRKSNRVSAHFTIGRDGTIVQSVPIARAAWHAGGSEFLELAGGKIPPTNARSIGVEVCNRGFLRGNDRERIAKSQVFYGAHRNPAARSREWEQYTQQQVEAISELAATLAAAVPTLRYHTGHEDVLNLQHTGGAKLDPGPAFPWERLTGAVRWDYAKRGWGDETAGS